MRPFSVFSIRPLSTAIGMLTFAVVGVLHFASVGAVEPLRFEAETVTSPQNAWQADRASKDKWNLWSTDKDADKKWSGGIVLQSPPVKQDRSRPEEGAPVLHTHVKSLPPGKYYVKLGSIGRPIGISLDGKTWKKIEGGGSNLGLIAVGKDGFHMLVDDRYASTTNPGSCYYDYLEFTPLPDPNRKPKVEGYAQTRVEESLDRGFVAMPVDGGRIYLGWRLLKDDPRNMAFDVYRRAGEKSPQKLNDRPITKTTDFLDAKPVPGVENEYILSAVVNGQPRKASATASATPAKEGRRYVSLKLNGDYTFQKCGIADLNGDGKYDYVIKQPYKNIDPYEKYWYKSPETYKIEAYLADGTFLWRYDMGWAIERGIWYSPYVVYDFDGDGKAEVCVKAGEGDPRDPDGRVTTGAEYVLVLDGMTGKEKARAAWPKREDFPSYNYASRNQMAVAYLDGKTPSLIVERGTYNVMQVHAYEYQQGTLKPQWKWDDTEEGPRFRGQGAHSMHAVDIDGDGRDELFLGSSVLDDNGVGLWSTGMGHPDHHYVGDIDPSRPGLEVYYGVETRATANGCCLVDARTGDFIWGIDTPTRHVHATGLCSDIDPQRPGIECYSSDTDAEKKSNVRWLFDSKGNVLRDDLNWGFGLRTVYWDADPQREIMHGGRIVKYGSEEEVGNIRGSVIGYADVLGDWREELIVSSDGELRIYTTTVPARDRRVCLMQDPLYRLDVCIQAMGYTQAPMTTNCLSAK